MAPPPAGGKNQATLIFKHEKAAARPKLDKAEITQMIDIQTEENRIVFEGMKSLWSWAKVTRTGRVLIKL